MSLCFMASCAVIKHLLGRQLICENCLLFFFSFPQWSNSLKVLFTHLCLLVREENESDNHRPVPLSFFKRGLFSSTGYVLGSIFLL